MEKTEGTELKVRFMDGGCEVTGPGKIALVYDISLLNRAGLTQVEVIRVLRLGRVKVE